MKNRNVVGSKAGFGDDSSDDDFELTQASANAHLAGFLKGKEGEKIVAKPIDIFAIIPDPAQPRRALPSIIRDMFTQTPDMAAFWDHWITFNEHQRPGATDFFNLALGAEGIDLPDEAGQTERALLDLLGLALNIRNEGLNNAITAAKMGDLHQIETGERRWLAYQLLYACFPAESEKWGKIPVRIVEQVDAFRQASENNQRENLNMVSRARQYSILMMAMQPGRVFVPYEECASDRVYYAQAAELTVPHGQRPRLLAAMGINSPGELTAYRQLLTLADEIWTLADDENWPKSKLFTAVNTLPHSPAAANIALSPLVERVNRQAFSKIWRALEQGGAVKREYVEHLKRWISEVESSGRVE